MSEGLVFLNGRTSAGAPILRNDEGDQEFIAYIQPGVSIVLNNSSVEETGTLYITSKRLIWLSDEDPARDKCVDFVSLTLHAISRDIEAYPKPCIYTQIDNGDTDEEDTMDDDQEEEVGEALTTIEGSSGVDLSQVSEMRLIPLDASVLDHLFKVLCDCAALNPDPSGEQEGEGVFFYNEEEMQATGGGSNGHHVLDHLDELISQDESRFDDAEEEDEEFPN